MALKYEQLMAAKQRGEMQKEQDKQTSEIKVMQQAQYRQVLKDQQVTKGYGLAAVVGSP